MLLFARAAQRQCCLGSLRERQCLAGINAARGGKMCEDDASPDKCGINSLKVTICDHMPQQRAKIVHWVQTQT